MGFIRTLRRLLGLPPLCLLPGISGAEIQPVIPVEHFFAEPDIKQVQLSPDGRNLSFLTTLGTGKVGIALMELATGKPIPLVAAKDENIDSYFWKGSEFLVYSGDLGGNESAAIRSFSLAKRKVLPLAESYRERYSDRANFALILDTLRYDPHNLLVFGPKDVGSWTISLWRQDVRNGRKVKVSSGIDEGKYDVGNYLVDNRGRILARTRIVGQETIYEVRADDESSFAEAARFPLNDEKWEWRYFAADNETLYLISREKHDTGALHTLNVRTRRLSEPLFTTPEGEIVSVLSSWDRTKLYGVSYLTDRLRYHFFDSARLQLQAQIDLTLPHTLNTVISSSADEQLLVIAATSDRDPGTYYLLDRRVPRLLPLGKINRHIKPEQMAPMEPVAFKARDGLVLHGYLTRPPGPGGKPGPLIIHPHGGPFGIRDEWGFNPEVQFLANRGYAVLQINYRGSGGYGNSFLRAGWREWGGKMQDDLSDGVQWAVQVGIADPKRVAIYGASYGGYAALAGATFTPELYCCAVNYVGVSDLGLITSWSRRGGDRGSEIFFKQWVGDDRAYLETRSPINFVERIRVPTLHSYGFNDPRVDIKHWTRLEPLLKKHGKEYEAIIEGQEGHGFSNESARIAFYRRLEAFLARHLGGIPAGRVEVKDSKVVEMPAKGTD